MSNDITITSAITVASDIPMTVTWDNTRNTLAVHPNGRPEHPRTVTMYRDDANTLADTIARNEYAVTIANGRVTYRPVHGLLTAGTLAIEGIEPIRLNRWDARRLSHALAN